MNAVGGTLVDESTGTIESIDLTFGEYAAVVTFTD